MQENRSFDHYFGTFPERARLHRPDGNQAARRQAGLLPAGPEPCQRLPAAVPLRHEDDVCPGHARNRPHLAHPAPGVGRREDGRLDSGQGPLHDGLLHAEDDIPFQRALARHVHALRQLPLQRLRADEPEPSLHVDRMDRPERDGRRPDHRQHAGVQQRDLFLDDIPGAAEQAGISWQVYQEEDNYDDNALAWFKQFASSPTSSASAGSAACASNRPGRSRTTPATTGCRRSRGSSRRRPRPSIPTTSRRPGREYIAQKLDAIASNPDVWAKTLFILTYDENDGMFDHVPPPTPPAGTPDEFVTLTSPGGTPGDGLPIGLGFRVPTHPGVPLDGRRPRLLGRARPHVAHPPARAPVRRHRAQHQRLAPPDCGDFTTALRLSRAARPTGRRRRPPARHGRRRTADGPTEVDDNPAPVLPAVNQPFPPRALGIVELLRKACYWTQSQIARARPAPVASAPHDAAWHPSSHRRPDTATAEQADRKWNRRRPVDWPEDDEPNGGDNVSHSEDCILERIGPRHVRIHEKEQHCERHDARSRTEIAVVDGYSEKTARQQNPVAARGAYRARR